MSSKIKRLVIRNFQKWKKLAIDLDPHVTVLVGRSDVGKSAILRALKWLALNRPSGGAFIRCGSDWARVSVDVGGIRVSRKKGKGKNSYAIDGKEFLAAGSKVPEEVARLFNLDETNFQGQHDSPLWFLRTPGEVSKELNRIVDLESIDLALGRAFAEARRAKAAVDVCRGRLAEARGRRKDLDWVPQADRELDGVEKSYEVILEGQERAARLAELLVEGRNHREALENAADEALGAGRAVSMGSEAVDLAGVVGDLSLLLAKVISQHRDIVGLDSEIKAANDELGKVETCPACGNPVR